MKRFHSIALICAATLAMAGAPAARQILERTVNRQGFKDACMRVQIKKTKKSGRTKTIEMTVFQKNYPEMTNILVRVESPEEASGISFLTWDYKDPEKPDQKFYYLPALKQYQQLSDEKGKSYEDRFGFSMDIFNIDFDRAEHRVLGEEDIDGSSCYRVESLMKDPDSPEGAKIVTWVRKDNWMAVKLEGFDRQGEMIREFELKGMEKIGDIWQETAGVYKDMKKGRTIEFKITRPRFNTGLKDEIFLASSNPEEARVP